MVDQRKRRRPEDADAGDGDRYDRNGLAMKRLIPAERRLPRLIDCERRNIGTMQPPFRKNFDKNPVKPHSKRIFKNGCKGVAHKNINKYEKGLDK